MFRAFLLCWFLATAAGVSHAQMPLKRYEFMHPQMGTTFKLVFFAPDDSLAARAAAVVFARIDSMNAAMSDYLPESELNRLCATAGKGTKVPVSADLWEVLVLSQRFSRLSDGAFDITIGALTRLWRRSRNLKELPDSVHLSQARAVTGFQKLRLYQHRRRVQLLQPGMQLDLGGIAQGFAADKCLAILRQMGIRHALVDAGGDIALGEAPPGKPGWEIEVPAPDGSTQLRTMSRCGITTSGARYRFLEIDSVRYSHIIDPRTGWGLTHRSLVTVQAPTAVEADAWATALSVLGQTGWIALRPKNPHIQVWITDFKL